MKITVYLITIVLLLTLACTPNELKQAESQYQQAIEQGKLFEQIELIDKLYKLAPHAYQTAKDNKDKLLAIIENVHNSDLQNISASTEQLEELISFSPNYPLFIRLSLSLKEKKKLQLMIQNNQQKREKIYLAIKQKLENTPTHIKHQDTELKLGGDFLASIEITEERLSGLLQTIIEVPLNSYQFEALLFGLNNITRLNDQLIAEIPDNNIEPLLNRELYTSKTVNEHIGQIYGYFYSQALYNSLKWTELKNRKLQNLVRTGLGIRQLDKFWQKEYQPVATKMQRHAEKVYISQLETLASYSKSIYKSNHQIHNVEPREIKKLIFSLLWPQDGLYEFYEQSEHQLAVFQNKINTYLETKV